MNIILDRFYNSLSNKVLATDDFNKGTRILSKKSAADKKYISNNRKVVKYLTFDIDSCFALDMIDDALIPTPTIISENPEKHTAHFFYELDNSVTFFENSRLKPQKFLADVENGLTNLLKADKNFNNIIVKNPLSNFHTIHTFNSIYDLNELNEYVVNHKKINVKETNREVIGRGRNCDMFDRVRYFAYQEVFKEKHNFESLCYCLQNKAESMNTYQNPLSLTEIRHICKSVAKWTIENKLTLKNGYTPCADLFSADWEFLDTKDKQKKSAEYTHKKRRDEKHILIDKAIDFILSNKIKSTHKNISKYSSIPVKSLSRYSDYIKNRLHQKE